MIFLNNTRVRTYGATLLLFATAAILHAEKRPVAPRSGPAPVGPYTPGVLTDDYLYISGQGAKDPSGKIPDSIEGQVRQTIENVKAIVEAAGLTMDHIVYTQVYLEDIKNFDAMNRVYAQYFGKTPPARATLGVAKLPGTPVEINAVAVRDLKQKRAVSAPGYSSGEPASAGILTHDRLYVSAMRGRSISGNQVPSDPAEQVNLALDGMKAVVEAAGLKMSNMVFVNPYLTRSVPTETMNQLYAKRFEFGNAPARATIQVTSLPEGAQIEFTGVAVRELSKRRAIRPKNMAPSATASPCVFAGNTLFCSAKSGFIPGPNGGIFATSVEHQLRQTMRNLLDNLEEAGLGFQNVVSTNVYLDNLDEFQAMNKVYEKYFQGIPPTRTTIQQVMSADRTPNEEGGYPALEQISLIAVR